MKEEKGNLRQRAFSEGGEGELRQRAFCEGGEGELRQRAICGERGVLRHVRADVRPLYLLILNVAVLQEKQHCKVFQPL